MADWAKIKTEYITTDTSYRKLAEKYAIDQATVARRAKKEGWVDARQRHADKMQAKTLNAISAAQAERARKLQAVADKLLLKIEEIVDTVGVSANTVRNITGAIRDIKEIQMVRSDADIREQEARIENLRRQAQKEEAGAEAPTLIIEGLPEEFKL